MTTNDADERFLSLTTPVSRRTLLASALVGIPAAAAGGSLALAHDDHDDDDKDDDKDDRDATGDDDDSHDDSHDDDHDEAAGHAAGSTEVHIVDDDEDAFSPGTIEVHAGDSVTWVNEDDKPHTATGGDWDTGNIDPGASATVTFDTPGEYPYACQYHPVMTGTVMVLAAGTPEASPAATPAGESAVTISNFAYDPAEIEAPVGATITWSNADQVPHTATGSGGSFDTGTIAAGETGSFTFDTAGTYEYGCAFHANMKGKVTIV